ncbi:uncharacterized protein BDV17DRAFT_142185 [Aspergillus undulatus]|uniref:uncharacterized protein n=1 Tax=Aspergillus undulatus TaxID=1810928 RepID=UPI003CCDF9BA
MYRSHCHRRGRVEITERKREGTYSANDCRPILHRPHHVHSHRHAQATAIATAGAGANASSCSPPCTGTGYAFDCSCVWPWSRSCACPGELDCECACPCMDGLGLGLGLNPHCHSPSMSGGRGPGATAIASTGPGGVARAVAHVNSNHGCHDYAHGCFGSGRRGYGHGHRHGYCCGGCRAEYMGQCWGPAQEIHACVTVRSSGGGGCGGGCRNDCCYGHGHQGRYACGPTLPAVMMGVGVVGRGGCC